MKTHGTRATYKAGCRCEDCTTASRDYYRGLADRTRDPDRQRHSPTEPPVGHRLADIQLHEPEGNRQAVCQCGLVSGWWSNPELAADELARPRQGVRMRTIRCLWCKADFGDDIGAYLDHRPCSRRVTAAVTAGPGDTPLVVRPPARPAATPHR